MVSKISINTNMNPELKYDLTLSNTTNEYVHKMWHVKSDHLSNDDYKFINKNVTNAIGSYICLSRSHEICNNIKKKRGN